MRNVVNPLVINVHKFMFRSWHSLNGVISTDLRFGSFSVKCSTATVLSPFGAGFRFGILLERINHADQTDHNAVLLIVDSGDFLVKIFDTAVPSKVTLLRVTPLENDRGMSIAAKSSSWIT